MENKEKKVGKIIGNIIAIAIVTIFLFFAWKIYQKNNFNEYVRAEYNLDTSSFTRDEEIKLGNANSYRIDNPTYNDAMFFKTIDVTPNTVYRVTCKIKTLDVEPEKEYTDVGAHISIGNTFEKSDNVTGTTDWKEVSFCFNSKNREKVDLGFRLGGAEGLVKGTAWFTDFTIETGHTDTSNEWNFLCVLFDNVDVDLEGENVKLELTQIDKDDIKACLRRFKSSMEEMSEGKMIVNYDLYEVTNPINHFSYDPDTGYYVSGYDVKDVLDEYLKEGIYDHIFIAFRTGDINKEQSIYVNDWIGLGSMEYRGLGFSNIRLPNDDKSYIYKFDSRINTFPEEVFIHEFLHTLERNAESYGYERPELHSNETYGYKSEKLLGLKKWYQDYMNKNINSSNGKIGLPEEIFTKKPSTFLDFEYSHKMDTLKEPENIIEELSNIYIRLRGMIVKATEN
ncbi:MAG: hypothetical protein J6M60_05930 [Clostridia bacterium]|nr:hypothetical protein [Clostridia bacterium]